MEGRKEGQRNIVFIEAAGRGLKINSKNNDRFGFWNQKICKYLLNY